MDKLEGLSKQSSSSMGASARKSSLKRNPRNSDSDEIKSDEPRSSSARPKRKTARFDEENIKKTYRPADKDYGFDKIEESKTPFERNEGPVDSTLLNERLQRIANDDQEDNTEVVPQAASPSGVRPNNTNTNGDVSASMSVTSTASFEERRKKHIQSEFIVAKQAPVHHDDKNDS